jgi:hypothetical protein
VPVKRRADKRRVSPEAELQMWSHLFQWGSDGFGDLDQLFPSSKPGIPTDEAAARAAAPDVWRRLGRRYLNGLGLRDETPWALRELGSPEDVPCR